MNSPERSVQERERERGRQMKKVPRRDLFVEYFLAVFLIS